MSVALLDTDMLSEVIKLRDPIVRNHALTYQQQHGPLTFSAVTRYEVLRGYKQYGATRQLANFAVFCQHSLILPVTDATWDRASDLWAYARQHGHPHDDADLVIAATALENQRILITGNLRHYIWIPGITVVDWRNP
ncbi:MAG: type II toxin-antitoxin system VapC family toxin [Schlesneria sp.]